MNSELESEEKADQKPNLRRRIRLSFWMLLLLVAITGWRVYLVRWPADGPSWNGLTVGQSTTEDVIAMLGEPSKIDFGLMSGTVYYYDKWIDESWGHPTIYFRNNRMIRLRFMGTEQPTLFTFVDQYGKPDHITEEIALGVGSPATPKGVYWSDEGIYVSVLLPESGFLSRITYFRPCPRFDGFCIMAEKWSYSGIAPPGKDVWGIMPPLPTPTITSTPTATDIQPTPDLLQLPFANNILFAPAADPDCQLPCWQGLRVGKSTDKDVQRIFDETIGFDSTIDFFSTNQYISRPWIIDDPGLYTTGYTWVFPLDGGSSFEFIVVTDVTTGILQGIQFGHVPGEQYMSHTPHQIIREVGTPDYILAEVSVNATGNLAIVRLRLIYKDGMNFGYGKHLKIIEDSRSEDVLQFEDFCLNEQPTSGTDYITLPFENLEEAGTNTLHQIWLVDYLKHVPLEPIEDVFGITIEEFVELALQDDPCIEINQDLLLDQ